MKICVYGASSSTIDGSYISAGELLGRRQQFDKPSVVKREKMQHAIYVQQLHQNED